MKVYFYDRDSGVYQGEGFETNYLVIGEEGVTVVAPPAYESGLVPVFDQRAKNWRLQQINQVQVLDLLSEIGHESMPPRNS